MTKKVYSLRYLYVDDRHFLAWSSIIMYITFKNHVIHRVEDLSGLSSSISILGHDNVFEVCYEDL